MTSGIGLEMSPRCSSLRIFSFVLSFYIADQTSLLTCVSPGTLGPQLTCVSGTSFVWVDRAYLARTHDATPSFCDSPTVDPTRDDCISSVDDVTNDVNSKCAFYQTCRLSVDYSFLNCSATYSGFIYLYADYECMATQIAGVSLTSMIISQTQTLTNQPGISYFRSADFPSFWTQQRGACRVDPPPVTRAVWRILDLRGRLINRPTGCAYSFEVYTRTFYRSWCADLRWANEQFDHVTSREGDSINFVFQSRYSENSEGKIFVNLNLTDANGNPMNGINITCGKDLVLDQPPQVTSSTMTTPTSTTFLSLPSSATSDMAPITTSTISTTTTPIATTSETTFYSTPSSSTIASPGEPLPSWNQSTEEATGTYSSFASSSPFQVNGTEVPTSANNGSNQPDNTVWLIIGLTVGGGLLLVIFIIITIAICGYKKRLKEARRQNEVLFAWEKAPGATPSSRRSASTTAKKKTNTYCMEPKPGVYLEITPQEINGKPNAPSRHAAAPSECSRNYTDIPSDNRSTLKSIASQVNPVYGQLPLTNYVLDIAGVDTMENNI